MGETAKSKFKRFVTCGFKTVAFILIFLFIFRWVNMVFSIDSESKEFQGMSSLSLEPENTLDAVYIGSSNCNAFWNPVVAFEEYGIAVSQYTCNSMPLTVTEYMIKEARKTQPNAVFLVNINTLGEDEVSDVVMHRLLDNMPFSKNKLELTKYMTDLAGLSLKDSLQYYFPLIRFHERWDELKKSNFNFAINTVKNSPTYNNYVWGKDDITEYYTPTAEKMDISQVLKDSLNSLLDYCDEEKIKVVFVTVPRGERSVKYVKKFNTVNEIVSKRGYPVLDLMDSVDELDLDITNDYYNKTHTNIHGSIKFTNYVAKYLIKNYGFKDKRKDPAYQSWNDAVKEYTELVKPYILDFELDSKSRIYSLETPKKLSVTYDESINLSWNHSEGAKGYEVYRKVEKEGAWTQIAQTDGNNIVDSDIKKDKKYYYTVVPFVEKKGRRLYGQFKYRGISLETYEEGQK